MAPPLIDGLTDLTEIGRGGFGVVYRAEQPAAGRQVAVKVLLEAMLDERSRERFAREGAAMGALSAHPNIVQLLQTGFTGKGDPFIVMPFMTKGSLRNRLEGGRLQWHDAVSIGVKLCGGLESAHAAGVLHRDIKPDNVLFSAYREPLLADFGIARVANHATTKTGSVTASIMYAPPEILNAESPTPASDVYSLAATLYEAMAGRAPFHVEGESSVAPVLLRIMNAQPPDLRQIGVPDPVWQIIAAALAKAPSQRPPTARVFGEALRRAESACGRPQTSMTVPDATPAAGPTDSSAPPGFGAQQSPQSLAQPSVGYQSGPQPSTGYQSGPQPLAGYASGSHSGPIAPRQSAAHHPGYQSGQQPPHGYPRGRPNPPVPGSKAPIMTIFGILLSLFGILLTPLIGGWGILLGYTGRRRGEVGAKGAIIVGWICLGLWIILLTIGLTLSDS